MVSREFKNLFSVCLVLTGLLSIGCIQNNSLQPTPTPNASVSPQEIFTAQAFACSTDDDCTLVNQNSGWACCYSGACQEIDYSEEKWISVNKNWFQNGRSLNCPSEAQCGPQPLCPVRQVNENYYGKCNAGVCKKTPKQNAIPQGFSIESSGSCSIPQNSTPSIKYLESNEFEITVNIPGSSCTKFGIESAYLDQENPGQLVISLKDATPPGTVCVQCYGSATAVIKGIASGEALQPNFESGIAYIDTIIVKFEGRQIASFPLPACETC